MRLRKNYVALGNRAWQSCLQAGFPARRFDARRISQAVTLSYLLAAHGGFHQNDYYWFDAGAATWAQTFDEAPKGGVRASERSMVQTRSKSL
jgi:hypothetical protein